MATKLRSHANQYWLASSKQVNEGVVVTALLHADRYLETQVYDYDAKLSETWTITIMDRETGRSVTLKAPRNQQRETTALILRQFFITNPPSVKKRDKSRDAALMA